MFLRLRCVDLEIALESIRISDTYFGHLFWTRFGHFRILAEEKGFFFAEKSNTFGPMNNKIEFSTTDLFI